MLLYTLPLPSSIFPSPTLWEAILLCISFCLSSCFSHDSLSPWSSLPSARLAPDFGLFPSHYSLEALIHCPHGFCCKCCSSAGKESACNAGDPGSIPGSGRYAGEGTAALSSTGLGNSLDRGAWQATGHGVTKSWHDWATFSFMLFTWFSSFLLFHMYKYVKLSNPKPKLWI